jgi:hypothetical protein
VGENKDVTDLARISKSVKLMIRVNVISMVYVELFQRSGSYYKLGKRAHDRGGAVRRRK